MKRVWLLRHAKSSWADEGLADHDRPLAARGVRAASRIARWADAHDVRPDLVLCSTAIRARATLALVVNQLGEPTVQFDGALYHASAAELLERLRALPPDVADVLLVGHNPGLHDLTRLLAPPGAAAFPTGALAGLRLEIGGWTTVDEECGRLETLIVPRALQA